ncbi:MAG: hypothetical protein LUC23_04800 [Prevotellaceae bacterium]|nr:hypothetical protein [Prevotellaceae bacterium]
MDKWITKLTIKNLMMRKYTIILTLTVTAALLAVTAGCTDEIVPASVVTSTAFTPRGEIVDAYLDLSVGGLMVTAGTKALTEDELKESDGESTVNDLWVFQYDATLKDLVKAPQYVSVTSQDEDRIEVPVKLSDNDGNPSIIYVVTNTGSSTWAEYANAGANYDGFITIDKLETAAIPTPKPQRLEWDYSAETYVPVDGDLSIPMSGRSKEETVTDGSTIEVPVYRMFAKLRIRVDLSQFDESYESASVYNVTVGNIPEYCTVGTLYTQESDAGAYATDCKWLTRAFSAGDSDDGDSSEEATVYPYVIYVPENIQGENVDEEDTKALSVTVDINAVTTVGSTPVTIGPYSFTAYPGSEDITTSSTRTNYNVKRNYVYDVTLSIKGLEDEDVALPSANCIICLSGETTAFYPYCREEAGGGYSFTDYVNSSYDAYGTDADTLRISTVEILWQSESTTGQDGGFIGDNSDEDNPKVWISDAPDESLSADEKAKKEYCRKIYVTIPEGETGNALIAARNSNNDIIWSWHIWSRSKADDPGNEANGVLYYTYDWDSDGIKYDQPRIAGYTVMNCNLGALQNVPDNSDYSDDKASISTFGNFYQWGRKDPFPAVKVFDSYADTYSGAVYSTDNVGNYYDNSNKQVNIDNSVDVSDSDEYLFHSYSDPEEATKFTGNGVKYAVRHPTVFMIGQSNVGSDNRYCWSRDAWYGYDLWGATDYNNANNTYDLPDGNNPDYNRLTDTYGPEKSIFDPCPYGWRVSPPDIWMGFTDTGLNPLSSWDEVNYDDSRSGWSGFTMYMDGWRDRATSTSYFPVQGTLRNEGKIHRIWRCGSYTNAIVDYRHYVNVTHFHYAIGEFQVFGGSPRYTSLGAPVRCVRFGSVSN